MTRDDVIWMAREANRYADTHADSTDCDWPLVRDEHFAELVRADERNRTWVGLTDEEVDEWTPEIHSVIRAIEAKLKEKNSIKENT